MIPIKLPIEIIDRGYIPLYYGQLELGDIFLTNKGNIRTATRDFVGRFYLLLQKAPNTLGSLDVGETFRCSVFGLEVCTKVELNATILDYSAKYSAFIVGRTVEVYENTLEVTKI